jgi:hypothetical protein
MRIKNIDDIVIFACQLWPKYDCNADLYLLQRKIITKHILLDTYKECYQVVHESEIIQLHVEEEELLTLFLWCFLAV